MHQSLIQWIGDIVEVVLGDSSVSVAYVSPDEWNFERVECFSGKIHEGDIIRIFDDDQQLIQAIDSESFC
jgi:hypothetical protein